MSKDKKIEKFLNEISIVSENKNELYEILVEFKDVCKILLEVLDRC